MQRDAGVTVCKNKRGSLARDSIDGDGRDGNGGSRGRDGRNRDRDGHNRDDRGGDGHDRNGYNGES